MTIEGVDSLEKLGESADVVDRVDIGDDTTSDSSAAVSPIAYVKSELDGSPGLFDFDRLEESIAEFDDTDEDDADDDGESPGLVDSSDPEDEDNIGVKMRRHEDAHPPPIDKYWDITVSEMVQLWESIRR